MSTWCRHIHVRPHCFILTEACSWKLVLAYFAGKISKNRLVCTYAVALAYYGSCRLLVSGSCINMKKIEWRMFWTLRTLNYLLSFVRVLILRWFELSRNQEKKCDVIAPSRAHVWFENKRFDWLSVNFFVHWLIRMLALLPFFAFNYLFSALCWGKTALFSAN